MMATRVSPILAKELLILPDLWLNIILHKAAPLGQSVGTFVPYMLPIGTFAPYMLPIEANYTLHADNFVVSNFKRFNGNKFAWTLSYCYRIAL